MRSNKSNNKHSKQNKHEKVVKNNKSKLYDYEKDDIVDDINDEENKETIEKIKEEIKKESEANKKEKTKEEMKKELETNEKEKTKKEIKKESETNDEENVKEGKTKEETKKTTTENKKIDDTNTKKIDDEKSKKQEDSSDEEENKEYKKVGKSRVKKKKRHIFRNILLILLAILIALIVYFFVKVQINGGGLKGILTTIVGSSKNEIDNLDDIYILCLGKSMNLTDTIIVVKYSPKLQEISMLSVPRDSFVGNNVNTATAFDKINAKYSISPQNTINAVNQLTGLNLKYYITVDTKALRELVDAIGGVYFDVPIKMDYDDSSQDLAIHIEPGYQLLNGEQAEGVVRFRHNNNGTSYPTEYGDNDLGRMRTQREFIKTVLSQTMKIENIDKINNLVEIAKERVETNISWDEIKSYIPALIDFKTENLRSDMLPGTPNYYNGVSIFVVNTTKSKEVVTNLFLKTQASEEATGNETSNNETIIDPITAKPASEIKIEVLNGTGSSTKFTSAITQLQSQGYKIVSRGTTNPTKRTLIIDRNSNTSETSNAIKSLLCTGTIQEAEQSEGVDYTIIIGQDY